ncbi:hypothetical protein [Microvirga sp. Mcv34]|uniref:hypothetical protein n=1 Tax=Microvirga sp. Mcv34 TaxID=2926016 RepID=UPI0021C7EBDA|nr:hypothetical protein [Microvirga sp. Mcv34]
MVSLLRLGSGHYSLEFRSEDAPFIQAAIRELFGEPRQLNEYAVSATVTIGNADFTYYYEWDDPCLISSSSEGDAVLTAIAQRLSQND